MQRVVRALLGCWYRVMGLPRHTPSWYRDRLREELRERREARTPFKKLSETADVFYIISRSRHDGHPIRDLPPFSLRHLLIYPYMVGKLTLRWSFYRAAACLCRAEARVDSSSVREVVNPAKDRKLYEVASRHYVDAEAGWVAGQIRSRDSVG
ncbi:hypothetical protein DL766_003323 [Monosporascus sp. MC13-8B]|uniref:Uncharacterized protein n=1 Tax=Monosporascus cannonballus TaxID=155416 RepID=A0ABY0HB64_9PEZI|nr:hypothetical protein DL762_004832 [Monosporascus cannonballus]RYO93177.1 hypothetical protein DL763_004449 [Monosporascus cannonballus]RYP33694.1 hypothetical protein DL766_003323 [Monosporascus sp. MC13-8B]